MTYSTLWYDMHIMKKKRLTIEEIKKGCIEISNGDEIGTRICRINEELEQGMTEMEKYTHSVTIYGSARSGEGDEYYEKARTLTARLSKELGLAITTGGGPGIMEGANRGAYEAGGKSIGLTIRLPHEQTTNPYLTDEVPFYFFFARKVALSYSAETFIFFPGGFGTLDEFFEMITLIQTKKIDQIPIILYGSDFWNPIFKIMKEELLEKFQTISPEDLDLVKITDDNDEVIKIIQERHPKKHEHNI